MAKKKGWDEKSRIRMRAGERMVNVKMFETEKKKIDALKGREPYYVFFTKMLENVEIDKDGNRINEEALL